MAAAVAALAVVLPAGACSHARTSHILFVGNSFTFSNGGIDQQLAALAPGTEVERVAVGGATLASHVQAGDAAAAIVRGGWDAVVLQDQSQTPVVAPDTFASGAATLDQVARSVGARTVLLATWERPDSAAAGVTTDALAAAYSREAARLHATVAPAGRAFALWRVRHPDVALTSRDGHPTPAGTYLAAAVVYGVVFNTSPAGNPHTGPGDPRVGAELQQTAADALGLGAAPAATDDG
jgi:hypothetical protein